MKYKYKASVSKFAKLASRHDRLYLISRRFIIEKNPKIVDFNQIDYLLSHAIARNSIIVQYALLVYYNNALLLL